MLACRVLGHRFRFRAEGALMLWECARGCGAGGSKAYPTPEDAGRYALALERDAIPDRGPPLLATLPLRMLRRARERRAGAGGGSARE